MRLSPGTKSMLERRGIRAIGEMTRSNIVVNTGRQQLAHLLGGLAQVNLTHLKLGDGPKLGYPPQLGDIDLISPITDTSGAVNALVALDQGVDITYPAAAPVAPAAATGFAASAGVLSVDPSFVSTFTDATVDFTSLGVAFGQQLGIETDQGMVYLTILEVFNANTIKVHNPSNLQIATPARWRVDSPGGQLRVSKIIRGNDFPEADFGPAQVITEAGLVFNNGVLDRKSVV